MPTRLIEFKEVGKFKKYPGGFCWAYCLKPLKKPSICLQGMTPSAPSVYPIKSPSAAKPFPTEGVDELLRVDKDEGKDKLDSEDPTDPEFEERFCDLLDN